MNSKPPLRSEFFARMQWLRRLLGTVMLIIAGSLSASPIYHDISVCHGFDCRITSTISLSSSEWNSIIGWLKDPAQDAKSERDHIRHAIGWMEVIVGRHGPGREDRALDLQYVSSRIGQMDCIDESINTSNYLKMFEQENLLRWHRVVERIQRRALFDAHWASQIEEIASGTRYVIDSWFQDNGMLPNVQKTLDWKDISFFTALRDNSKD